jgi:hypothetical protein
MDFTAMMKHIGRGKRFSGNKSNEPTDDEKSELRLKQMEANKK